LKKYLKLKLNLLENNPTQSMDLDKLFNPKSIAIVGASEEEGKVGNVIAKNILELGYQGEVFLVNPKHEELFGQKCYPSIIDIGKEIDIAIVAIPAKFVNAAISESAVAVKNFVVISAGFGETDAEGKKREEELAKITKEKNLNILGPNCLGFIIPELKLNASFAGGMPEAGNIALVSQSGALAVAIMDAAKNYDFKFSRIISIGNKMQIGETALMEYSDKDQKTKVIALYLEGVKNGKEFIKAASAISKPIVVLKAGKTEKSQKAISSHTGALAGSDEIMRAVFGKTGILRADNLEDFFDLITLISNIDFPRNNSVAVITNAGGPGVLTADAFNKKEIKLAEFGQEIKNKLKGFLPEESSVENPIDLLGDAREDRYEKALEIVGGQEGIGAVICVLTPQDQTPVDRIAEKIIEFKKKTNKVVLAVFIGGERIENAVGKFRANGVAHFLFPDRAVESLDKYYQWQNFHKARKSVISPELNADRREKAVKIIKNAKKQKRSALLFSEAGEIMGLYGIKVADSWDEKREIFVFPVVVKIDSDKVLHKTDKQGLILDIKDEKELSRALVQMKNNFPGEHIIIQPMLPRQTELIAGIKQDPVFGPVIVCGLGGIYTEIFKAVDFFIPPFDIPEIKNQLKKGALGFLFRETRGQKAYNLEEIALILSGLGDLAREIGEISELDINPILVYNDGKEAVAVDVKIII